MMQNYARNTDEGIHVGWTGNFFGRVVKLSQLDLEKGDMLTKVEMAN